MAQSLLDQGMNAEQQGIYERIRAASAADEAVYLNPPCDPATIAQFREHLRSRIGEEAEWYVPLLRVTNGLQIDNSILLDADELIATNEERRADDPAMHQFLVFGSSGNVDQYVYDTRRPSEPFIVANFFDTRDISETYPSLEALLASLLDAATK